MYTATATDHLIEKFKKYRFIRLSGKTIGIIENIADRMKNLSGSSGQDIEIIIYHPVKVA